MSKITWEYKEAALKAIDKCKDIIESNLDPVEIVKQVGDYIVSIELCYPDYISIIWGLIEVLDLPIYILKGRDRAVISLSKEFSAKGRLDSFECLGDKSEEQIRASAKATLGSYYRGCQELVESRLSKAKVIYLFKGL